MSLFNQQKIYWLEILLSERFGIPLKLEIINSELVLSLQSDDVIIVFNNLNPSFHALGETSLNCIRWNPESEGFLSKLNSDLYAPGLSEGQIFRFQGNVIYCSYDILGLTFWSLNRLEEINNARTDSHSRFPFIASHAFKYGYIEYPIVDQWLDILKQSIQRVNKNILLKKNSFKPYITHDIDRPARYYFSENKIFFKSLFIDFIRSRKLINLLNIFPKFFGKEIPILDPYNTFNWLMDLSDKYNLQSSFFFICGGNSKYDANYDITSLEMRKVVNNILDRGHTVGIHPSYLCYLDSNQIIKEMNELKKILPNNVIHIGGRMHYLRFKYPETLHNLVSANVKYDTTIGYADHIGFRCGTSHSYYPFDPLCNAKIGIRVFPLIVMDSSLTSYMKMRLDDKKTYERVDKLIERCRSFGGNFVLLWHNSQLTSNIQRRFYEKLISNLSLQNLSLDL